MCKKDLNSHAWSPSKKSLILPVVSPFKSLLQEGGGGEAGSGGPAPARHRQDYQGVLQPPSPSQH